jgi:DnaJ-class molecular chaperone
LRKPKLKSRPLRIEKPTGERCKSCFGSGAIRGAVSEYTCGECGGLGLVSTDQDYFADLQDALASKCIAQAREIRELRESLRLGTQRIGSKID